VKPARFDYYDPRTFEEGVEVLASAGTESKVMAGGQSLMPLMNMRLVRPAVVVDINRVEGASYVKPWEGGVAVGATTRQRSLEWDVLVAERLPILQTAARHIGHTQIRSRGTICGSIAHADPAAELPALALALDAEMEVQSKRGKRTVAAADFFVDYLTTSLEPSDLLVEVRLPGLPPRTGTAFVELSRRHGDFALVGVAAALTLDEEGRCHQARIALIGVGPAPVRELDAEKALRGQMPSEDVFRAAGRTVAAALQPESDLHASAEYRRDLAEVLVRRALVAAHHNMEVVGA